MPSTVAELSHALHDNVDFLSTQKKMKASFDLYSTSLKELSKRFSEISEKRGNNLFFQLLHFEDEHEENFGGPAYSLSVNHHAKRITIAFRGSVTAKDFICDWKTSLRSIPNPLAGEARSGRDYLKIHRGFKEYLYDPMIETMSSKGVVENQALVLHLVTKVAKIFEDHPEYHLYTTGHSLGGALAILFTMEAGASKDLRIRKPVTCITIASPRVGNVSFAKAFKVCP
jgi:predicted lipase